MPLLTINLVTDTDITLRLVINSSTVVAIAYPDDKRRDTVMEVDLRDADGNHIGVSLCKSVARAALVADHLFGVEEVDQSAVDLCLETVREGVAHLLIAYGYHQGKDIGNDLLGCILSDMTVRSRTRRAIAKGGV